MRDILTDLLAWRSAGRTDIALATIVRTRGSSLRKAGTRMALNSDGDVLGSVSSGCVDGDVIAALETVLSDRLIIRRPSYDVSDELAWHAGLACGGEIEVLMERWEPLYDALMAEMLANRPVAFATRLDNPAHMMIGDCEAGFSQLGTLGDAALDEAVIADLLPQFPGPYTQKLAYPEGEVFVEVLAPPPELLIFGATDIGAALAQLAQVAGFRVIVSDARRTFLREERFPGAEVRFGWPQQVLTPAEIGAGTSVVILFHDEKFDIPALSLALRSRAPYIGFLGSQRTQAARQATLIDNGFSEDDLSRIYGPAGLDIGGSSAGDIALSILAEVVAVRHRREGGTMRNRQYKKQESSDG